jgi:hypothetical protein
MSTLQELGFSREEIEQKVVTKIADDLLNEYFYESDTGGDGYKDSRLKQKFHEIIKVHVERKLNKLAEEYIVPHVRQLIEGVALQRTNEWGEKKGEPKTFIEYLTESAQGYLMQPVDFQGKPTERGGYSTNTQTRLIHLVHEHLHYSIDTAMKNAVDEVKKALTPALQSTVEMKLGEIAKTLKINVVAK